ncbi:unnamed protein product [Euphydryas editha]|uniref:Uncharacterized protein n=1 Tax=Euphydryas editha TaxID=104508 RepID=A0AAU9UTU1_EUPED|nr:unnamed protein product [Euphydryas editha]
MRVLRILRCRPFSTRMLALLLVALAFGVYCYYYTVSAAYPKPGKCPVSSGRARTYPGSAPGYRKNAMKRHRELTAISPRDSQA